VEDVASRIFICVENVILLLQVRQYLEILEAHRLIVSTLFEYLETHFFLQENNKYFQKGVCQLLDIRKWVAVTGLCLHLQIEVRSDHNKSVRFGANEVNECTP